MMKHRDGRVIDHPNGQDKLLAGLYGSVAGRAMLRLLVSPVISKAAGAFLSSGMSQLLIGPFIRKNQIDMAQFEPVRYRSYNEFFSRKIRPEARPVDMDARHMIAVYTT